VLHLVSARGRTVLIVACTDERSFARWSAALAECLALAKCKHSSVFPSPAAMAAAAAAAQKETEGAAARSAEVAARQAEREAFRQRIGPVGMANTAAIMAGKQGGAAPAPGLNPAARGPTQAPLPPPPTKEQLQEQRAFDSFFDGVAPRPQPQGAGGLSAAALASASRAQQQNLQQQTQARAQVALNRAASAASTGFAAFRDGLGSIARQIEASMPPPAPGQR
jgi:hypothetical protein